MRVLLELIRIIIVFAFVGGILGYIVGQVYLDIGIDTEKYGWMGFFAIFILFFVLYRNKLQFSGWYKGEGRKKLPKIVTRILIVSSIILLSLPPVVSFYFS